MRACKKCSKLRLYFLNWKIWAKCFFLVLHTNSASCICYSVFLYFLHCFVLFFPYFQSKLMEAVSAFMSGNYLCQPAVAYLLAKSVNLFLYWNLNVTSLKMSVLLRCLICWQLLKYSPFFIFAHGKLFFFFSC